MENERALSRPLHDRASSSRTTYGEPAPLKLGRTVFLSHSGSDKDFVWFLHRELCRRYRDSIAFFDVETLPKATPVSMDNILEEARRSQLGVLVLTEDFFMKTPNPMRELDAFVASEVQLLPLFFKMSVDEFKEKSRRAKWEKKWRKWFAKKVGGSNVEGMIQKWRHALEIVNTFSGLEYCKEATNQPEYVDKVVKEVTRIIHPAISFSEEEVCGKARLCQVVNDLYKKCALKRLSSDPTTQIRSTNANYIRGEGGCRNMLDVVGIYGFAGIGKTTLCRCLCDFYFAEFNARVCYIDLGWLPYDQSLSSENCFKSFTSRMLYILSMLTTCNNVEHSRLDVYQVKNLFKEHLSSLTDPIFLAIDINILRPTLDQFEAIEEVDFYLKCGFPEGSKIFITSRNQDILKNLTSQYCNFSLEIIHMPAIEFKEARDIFVHEIPQLRNFGTSNVEHEVNECVKMCMLYSEDWRMQYFHPLMLKSLAASIRCNQDWKGRLRKLQSEGIVNKNGFLKLFTILDNTFTILSKEVQTMFLDFALFYRARRNGHEVYAWIKGLYSHIHKDEVNEMLLQLQELCFIEKISWRLLNLVVDFCWYKVTQGDYAQYYEIVEANAHWRDVIPRSVRYISISGCGYSPDRARAVLDLRDVEAVEVLHLVDNHAAGVQEVLLSRTTCAHLRSLIVRVPSGTLLQFIMDENWSSSAAPIQGCCQGRRPCRLYWLELKGNVCFKSLRRFERIRSWLASSVAGFQALQRLAITAAPGIAVMDLGSGVLGELRILEFFHLSHLRSVQSIDVMACSNLKNLELMKLPCLRSIGGLDKSTGLKFVADIRGCEQLQTLTIHADSNYEISNCASLKRISISTKSSYPGADSSTKHRRSLRITECPMLRNIDGLLQYTGEFFSNTFVGSSLEETVGDWLEAAAIDSSICKAGVQRLTLSGQPAGLAGVERLHLWDAQHIGLLISALSMAQPERFLVLNISCKAGDCGCDKHAPQFGPLELVSFGYHCHQVRDLASLAHWHSLRSLDLSGCMSVDMWPDFATMTCLRVLDLSHTSLKEWPASLQLLRDLRNLNMRGCRQLSAEELMKGISLLHELQQTPGHASCIAGLLRNLLDDLKAGERDGCSVVDALDLHYPELVTLFHPSSFSANSVHNAEVSLILELIYQVWFEEGEAASGSLPDMIRTKLGRLLCSENTLALPFRDWSKRSSIVSVTMLMEVALIGGASIGWYKAAVNDDLKDSIVLFLKWFTHATIYEVLLKEMGYPHYTTERYDMTKLEALLLRKRVGEAVCKMARVPSVATALGAEYSNIFIQSLEARVHYDYENALLEISHLQS